MTKEPKSWFADFVNKTLKGNKPVENVQPTSEEERRAVLEREKEEATKAGKAWVAVLDTQVNPENIKNGFFELDWNNQFIEELLDAGYSGETNEAIKCCTGQPKQPPGPTTHFGWLHKVLYRPVERRK